MFSMRIKKILSIIAISSIFLTSAPLNVTNANSPLVWIKKPTVNHPLMRGFHTMAYDEIRNETVLFGGSNGTVFNDTWVWDGTNWTQKNPTTSPSTRIGSAMVYDAARQEVVLFGGLSSGTLNDTWVWDGTNWTQKNPTTSPPVRWAFAMTFDETRQEVVLFGGNDNDT